MSGQGEGGPETTRPGTLVRRTAWPDSASVPVVTPLQPSVVYAARDADALDAQYEGRTSGYAYAREGHPNADVLAAKIDGMHGLTGGIVTGSGMAAVSAALLATLSAGDHLVAADQLYGRSRRLLAEDLPRMGIEVTLADPTDAAAIAAAVTPRTKAILVEVVSNPTLRIADMAGIAQAARQAGVALMVDNTFTTPLAVQPAEQGADIVIESITKMLAGHSDVTLGYVGARDPATAQRIRTLAVTFGMTPSPFDCWLAERGLYTFELRYDRAEATAGRLAAHLGEAAGVARVLYPDRPDHPDAGRLATILGGRPGTMVTFDLAGGRDAVNAFANAVPELPFAPTLGDVATTVSHPASSSHRALSPEARGALGITEGTLRMSVGIESPDYVLDAVARGLAAAG